MKKDKKIKLDAKTCKFIARCNYLAAVCFYIVSLLNLFNEENSTGVIFLCLGSTFLCLGTVYQGNEKGKK